MAGSTVVPWYYRAWVSNLSLAENRNFKFVLSSCVWKAACAAPKQMLVILSFQKLNLILSYGLSTDGLRHKMRAAFCRWTRMRCTWSLFRLELSVSTFHLRIVTADTNGIISFKLVIDDSNESGYCSSFRMVVSSTDWRWGSVRGLV